jgi:hypothetical protein
MQKNIQAVAEHNVAVEIRQHENTETSDPATWRWLESPEVPKNTQTAPYSYFDALWAHHYPNELPKFNMVNLTATYAK